MQSSFSLNQLDEKKNSFGKSSSPNQKLPKTTFRIYAWSIGHLDLDLGSVWWMTSPSKLKTVTWLVLLTKACYCLQLYGMQDEMHLSVYGGNLDQLTNLKRGYRLTWWHYFSCQTKYVVQQNTVLFQLSSKWHKFFSWCNKLLLIYWDWLKD